MNTGFADVEHELYFQDDALMVLADARAVLGQINKSLSGEEEAA
jgi:NAD/NADP transhydrogenase beta subunit